MTDKNTPVQAPVAKPLHGGGWMSFMATIVWMSIALVAVHAHWSGGHYKARLANLEYQCRAFEQDGQIKYSEIMQKTCKFYRQRNDIQ